MANEEAIQVQNLYKEFGDNHAVNGVNFEVNNGEIFSLLGPNGAGKSTTISMLSCLLQPTLGDALVMGHSVATEPQQVKKSIGVVPQEIALYRISPPVKTWIFGARCMDCAGMHYVRE